MNVFIYALKEPDTGEIRYIGKSSNPQKRLQDHLCTQERGHRGNWIRLLKSQGQTPILKILDEVPEDLWESAEMGYIHLYQLSGQLVNDTPGGDCPPIRSGWKHSPDALEKISQAQSGEKNHSFGKSPSVLVRAKISKSLAGRKQPIRTEAHRLNLGAALAGRKLTPEHCAKIAEIRKGKSLPEGTGVKISKALSGRKKSPEHVAKVVAGLKEFYAKRKLDSSIQNCMVSV